MARRKTLEAAIDKLPPKKAKYVAGVAEGKSKMQAALDAGYSAPMAENAKARIESEDVKSAFRELVRSAIPAARITNRLSEGLDATFKEVPDYRERREYLQLAVKYGGYHDEKQILELQQKPLSECSDEELVARVQQLAATVSAARRDATDSGDTGAAPASPTA